MEVVKISENVQPYGNPNAENPPEGDSNMNNWTCATMDAQNPLMMLYHSNGLLSFVSAMIFCTYVLCSVA